MCVQAAFSPLRLPSVKGLFRPGNSNEMITEKVETSDPSSSSSSGEGTSWIPLLEPRFKTQSLPRVLTLPEPEVSVEEKVKTPLEEDMEASDESEGTNDLLQEEPVPFPSNNGESVPKETNGTTEKVEEAIIDNEEEITESLDPNHNEDKSNPPPEDEDGDAPEENPPKQQISHAPPDTVIKKKVVTTVEVEEDVVGDVEKGGKELPVKTEMKANDKYSPIESPRSSNENSKAFDGKRSAETIMTPPLLDDDEDNFSPRLGPVDIMEHRKLMLPKHSTQEGRNPSTRETITIQC
mmetsp:Transcript_18254/g.33916  ORF Transcript_18254/g.33916 Transcript_18254/m.33916 type:complete len:294 (-) Transcript_18254:1189-2070(-)